MTCHNCQIQAVKIGKDRKGNQRFRCNSCRKTFQLHRDKPLENMRLPMEKAILCLKLLVEGNSIRSTERITGVKKTTIINLLILAGEKCERLLNDKIKGLSVRDVQADEMWGFVGMKERTKKYQLRHDEAGLGDAYTFVAIERNTKLVLAWHLGRRTSGDTEHSRKSSTTRRAGIFSLLRTASRPMSRPSNTVSEPALTSRNSRRFMLRMSTTAASAAIRHPSWWT